MHNKKFPSLVAIFAAAIALFSAANSARATDINLIISEVLVGGNSADEEFIELYNPTSADIDLKLLPLKLHTVNSFGTDTSKTLTYTATNSIIKSHDYLLLASASFRDNHSEIAIGATYSAALVSNGAAYISSSTTKDTTVIDLVCWGNSAKCALALPDPKQNYSMERIENSSDWQESCKTGGTPGEEPKICEIESGFSSEGDEISDPAVEDSIESSMEASLNNDDETNAPKKVYSKNLKITELLPNPSSNEDTGEFTELYNADSQEIIELSGWKIEDKTGNSYPLPNISLQPSEYRAFYRNSSKFSLNNTGSEEIFLKNPDGEIVDHVSYSGTVKENYAYALASEKFEWTSTPTPGAENVFDALKDDDKNSKIDSESADTTVFVGTTATGNVYLNEILPNPKDGSDGEYIEIMNGGSEAADLAGWRIKDASKSKGYQFKEHTAISPGEYLAIYRPDSKIALNNSDESVYLYNPKNEIASSVSFAKSIKNSSYNFDGKIWKWSKYLTPGKKNQFDSPPDVKIKKIKVAYKDLFTEFSAKAKDKETKKLKYTWDFGDGKKSTLAKTSHKYLDTGKYTVTLSVSDDSQTVEKSFVLNVKNSPRPNLELAKIVPNPTGNDSEGEIVEIKNNSSKKIDLADWKIAIGSGEKMYNHPISGEFTLDANETKTITREFSKFSLNNKAGKVQLVMPDGKVIDEVEYAKEKIADDEAYAKIDGEWKWLEPGAQGENTKEAIADEKSNSKEIPIEDTNNDGEVLGATDEDRTATANYDIDFSSEDAYVFLSRINFGQPAAQNLSFCPASNPSSNIAYLIASTI